MAGIHKEADAPCQAAPKDPPKMADMRCAAVLYYIVAAAFDLHEVADGDAVKIGKRHFIVFLPHGKRPAIRRAGAGVGRCRQTRPVTSW